MNDGQQTKFKRIYTRQNAAVLMGVSVRVLQTAIDKGHIKALRFGSRILVPGSEVQRFFRALDGEVSAWPR